MSALDATETFRRHRSLLFTFAYEMLGSAADAEDVVQETWLRWDAVEHAQVRDARAYLVRIVTRQALNRLRTLKRQRETYVGPWLPEPLVTSPDVAEDVELSDSVSFAMLVVLETLTPLERAVFVLREVFGFEYDEIAAATDRTNTAVRQVAHRARQHVQARRPRTVDAAATHRKVAEQFFVAAATGDVQRLMDLLAPDVVMLSDGGGKVKAALRPIEGADKVVRWLMAVRPEGAVVGTKEVDVNGAPAALLYIDGVLDVLATIRVEDGLVRELYLVRNPDKLADLAARQVTR
jgi:RNA polymerase sigma-70 factor (TIGR02957 family)